MNLIGAGRISAAVEGEFVFIRLQALNLQSIPSCTQRNGSKV
jgi:hypothetical protein